MTFGWRTLVSIEGDIGYRFSISGVTQRHSVGVTGRVRQLFNESWRELRELVAFASDGAYLQRTAAQALPVVAAVTGDVYAEIPWPTDAVSIYAVRCLVNGTQWYSLKRIPFSGLLDYQYQGLFTGFAPNRGPIAFCTRIIPDGAANVETAGAIMLVPIPLSGTYVLWYLQGWADRTADTDTFPGLADFHEWAILNTLVKMSQPDGDSNKQVQIWMAERERVEGLITCRAQKLEAGLPMEPRDARSDGYDSQVWAGPL
jgi:hypothetical protein